MQSLEIRLSLIKISFFFNDFTNVPYFRPGYVSNNNLLNFLLSYFLLTLKSFIIILLLEIMTII